MIPQSSSAATAKLADVIEETNRIIEYEKRALNQDATGRAAPMVASDGSTRNRISPTKQYSDLLGESEGISTVTYHRPHPASEGPPDPDEVPRNRIFLNQKPRYEG